MSSWWMTSRIPRGRSCRWCRTCASGTVAVAAFSSLDEARESVRSTDFLAADLVRAAVAVIEPLARQKHLAFQCNLPDEPIRMTSDVDKIRQILVNLAGNAVKFTD